MPSVEVMRQQLAFLGQSSEGNRKTLKDRLRKYVKKHPDTNAILSAAKLQDDDASDHEEEGQKLNEGPSTHGEDKDQDTVQLQQQEPPPPPPQQQQQQLEQQKEQKQKEKQKLQQEREQAQRRELVEKINEEKQKYEERRERQQAQKREREELQKQAQEKRHEREQRLAQEQKAKREQELKRAQESNHKNGAKPEPEPEAEQEQEPTQEPSSTQTPPPATGAEQESGWKQVSRHALHKNSRYDYYLCFDVEATCEEGFSFEFPNEVIEFPVVLLDGTTLEVVRATRWTDTPQL